MTIKNQKGVVLILAMCTVLMMALIAQLFTFIIINGLHRSRKEWNTTSALYIAKAGANEAIRRLQKGDTITTATTGNLLDGTYTYKSVTDGTNNWIESTGITHGESQIVRIAYGTSSSSGGVDPAFDYAVFTDGKQWYQGGGGDPIVTGNIHSNNKPPFHPDYPTKTYPDINNPSHYMVGSGYTATSEPPKGFPTLNIRYDTNSDLKYYNENDVEINNDYWHIATVGGTSNGDSNNHYYHDFEDTKLPSGYKSANMSTSPDLPNNNGVTLIISTSATPPTVTIGSGSGTYTGTLIIVGANATMSGHITFNGLIFVKENKLNKGGDLTISGSPTINGAVICKTLDAGSGTPHVVYNSSYFKAVVKTDDKEASLKTFSWQAEY